MAETIIEADKAKGSDQVLNDLNAKVRKYEQPSIFTDSKRSKYLATHYRQKPTDNLNEIANNNTSLRVFGINNPVKEEVEPILD